MLKTTDLSMAFKIMAKLPHENPNYSNALTRLVWSLTEVLSEPKMKLFTRMFARAIDKNVPGSWEMAEFISLVTLASIVPEQPDITCCNTFHVVHILPCLRRGEIVLPHGFIVRNEGSFFGPCVSKLFVVDPTNLFQIKESDINQILTVSREPNTYISHRINDIGTALTHQHAKNVFGDGRISASRSDGSEAPEPLLQLFGIYEQMCALERTECALFENFLASYRAEGVRRELNKVLQYLNRRSTTSV